jgi:hypothetical protein
VTGSWHQVIDAVLEDVWKFANRGMIYFSSFQYFRLSAGVGPSEDFILYSVSLNILASRGLASKRIVFQYSTFKQKKIKKISDDFEFHSKIYISLHGCFFRVC